MRFLGRFHVAVLLILILFILTHLLLTKYGIGDRAEKPVFSSYVSNRFGLKALFLLLADYEVTAQRWPHRWTRTPPGRHGLMVAARPQGDSPVIWSEVKPLLDWVERGNSLLLLTDAPSPLTDSLRVHLAPGRLSTVPQDLDLTPDESLERHTGIAQAPLAYTSRAERIAMLGDAAIRWDAPLLPLYGRDGELHAALARRGGGSICVVSDPALLSNGLLDHRQNLEFFLNLLTHEEIERVYFDEFHQGYGKRPTFTQVMGRTHLRWVFLHVALGALFSLLLWGRRRSRPVPVRRAPRRSATEYVESMALVLQSAAATGLALQEIFRGFRGDVGRKLGLNLLLNDSQFIAKAAVHTQDPKQFRFQMDRYVAAMNRDRVDRRAFLKYVRSLERWRKGIVDGKG